MEAGDLVDSAKLQDWLQIIGAFSIVASLIFVGLQLRQTQEIAIANQYQDRAALSANFRLAVIQSDVALGVAGNSIIADIQNADGWPELKSMLAAASPDPQSAGFMRTQIIHSFFLMDNNHFQYQSGFLPESTWRAYESELDRFLDSDLVQFVWEQRGQNYRPEFRQLVNDLIQQD